MKFNAPVPVEMWKTTDGQTHSDAEKARAHQIYLDVIKILPKGKVTQEGYLVITELAKNFDFVERT